MTDRCQICRRVDEAFTLLAALNHRDRIEEHERIPAWRAIKQLYRAGARKETCQGLVDKVRGLGKPGCGPTLSYYVKEARLTIERLRDTP